MAKRPKKARVSSSWDTEAQLLTWLATCVAVFAFLFYFQRGDVLLYGDAVAHMNIARRVFDSKTPGLLQLGTVWLPLPHLLMVPFLLSDEMWHRGVGGSIPSLIAYVFGVVGMFRLVRGTLSRTAQPDAPARIAAWIAALVYAANPSLVYLQTTAMGESVYLAFFIWTVVYFGEAYRGNAKALTKSALCLAAACFTRYDAWFLAVVMAAAAILFNVFEKPGNRPPTLPRAALAKFVLIAAAAPILWLTYNAIVYRNPLEFANGPYSARAIERRSQTPGNPGHPGSGNLVVAGLYFVKSAEANVAENQWLQRAWILVLFAALAITLVQYKRDRTSSPPSWPFALLLLPIPFYALSVAYGGVPIFIPAWWPFTHYNVRYGLQLLPACAAALAVIVYFAIRSDAWSLRLRLACVLSVVAFVIASYASVWRAGPQSLQEAQINMRSRNHLETQLAGWLHTLPPDSTLLMYLGDHVGALQQAGIPLKRVINEGNHRVWMQPEDPEGLWERALADPEKYTDYVVAIKGDRVWQAVQGRHLKELVEIHTTGQPPVVLYRAR